MDIIIYLALIVFMIVFVSVLGFWGQKKLGDSRSYILANRKMNAISTALSSWLSDFSLFAVIIIPMLAISSIRGTKQGILLGIAVLIGGGLSWLLIARRLRVYAEVTGAVTIPEYMDKRFKSSSGVARTVSAVIGFVFSVFIAGYALSVAVTFCDALFGVGRTACVMLCMAAIAICLIAGGISSVIVSNVIQTILVLIALIGTVVFAYLGNGTSQLSVISENIKNIPDVFPRLSGDFYHISFLDIGSFFSVCLCWAGLPPLLTHFMAGKDKRQYRRASNISLICSVCSIVCAVLLGVLSYPIGGNDSPAVLQSLNLINNSYIKGGLLFVFFISLLSISSTYLMTATTYIAYDLYPRIWKTKEREISLAAKIVAVLLTIAIGLIAWEPRMGSPVFLVVAIEGFAAAFGPVVFFSLYYAHITHRGAVCCMLTGAGSVFIFKLFTYFVLNIDGFYFYELFPAFILSTSVLLFVSRIDKKRERKAVLQEFERVCTIMRCKNQYRVK